MAKTNKQRVLDYLQAIAPEYATNADIREATGINSHQQVYMLTQELQRQKQIEASRRGREWVFRASSVPVTKLEVPPPVVTVTASRQVGPADEEMTPRAFEVLASRVMSEHYHVPLRPGQVGKVPKLLDLVSPDGRIVGDAKYYTLVGGQRLPPAKFSVIAEYVWLLEKTKTPATFLVFGNDRRVPELWLARYGGLVESVLFYFLSDNGKWDQISRQSEVTLTWYNNA